MCSSDLNRLTFVLAGVREGETAEAVAQRITDQTGLKALPDRKSVV